MERWTKALELTIARMSPMVALRQLFESRTQRSTVIRSGSGSVR